MMHKLPTEINFLNLSNAQVDALAYMCKKLDDDRWDRLCKTLGTKFGYYDIHPPVSPDESKEEGLPTEIVMPLSTIIQPKLMEALKKTPLAVPTGKRREGGQVEGHEMSKAEFKELFEDGKSPLADVVDEIQELEGDPIAEPEQVIADDLDDTRLDEE